LKIESPAILVVGDVVRLRAVLGHKKIAILRPEGQQAESARLAELFGFQAIMAPAIAIQETPLPGDLMERLNDAECVVFTSANGVKMALENKSLQSALAEKKIVAIGPKTELALAGYGLKSDVPLEYSSAGLETMLKGQCRRILFLRSAQGSQYLSEGLRAAGLQVDDIPLYEVVNSGDPRLDELIRRARSVDIFAFTSSSTARNLIERAKALGEESHLYEALRDATVAAIGKPTREELARLGVRVDTMPEIFTFEAMLLALAKREQETLE
jgi:uroporphyrinogen-III synthase